jgi:hypothetical protein
VPASIELSAGQVSTLCETLMVREDLEKSLVPLIQNLPIDPKARELSRKSYDKTIEVLKNADHIPYRAMFFRGYENSRPNQCQHPIILLGERHIKLRQASDVGRKLLGQFHFRGLESFSTSEYAKANQTDKISDYTINEVYPKLRVGDHIRYSTLEDAVEHGYLITGNVGLLYDQQNGEDSLKDSSFKNLSSLVNRQTNFNELAVTMSTSRTSAETVKTELSKCNNISLPEIPVVFIESMSDPVKFAATYPDLLKATANSEYYNFFVEAGPLNTKRRDFDCSNNQNPDCQFLILNLRNERMAKNIVQISHSLPCGEPFLVITGWGHLEGLSAELEKMRNVFPVIQSPAC